MSKKAIVDSLSAQLMSLPQDIMSYKLAALQNELAIKEKEKDREHDLALNTQRVMIDTLGQKRKEFNEAKKALDKFGSLPQEFVSLDGPGLKDTILDNNTLDINAMQSNIDIYSDRILQLDDQLTTLNDQKRIFEDSIPEYWGLNQSLQQGEYELFQEHAMRPKAEGGLGWITTAGSDLAYREGMTKEQIARHLEEQHTIHTAKHQDQAAKKFELLKAIYSSKDDEGDDRDVVKALSSDVHTPNALVISEISNIMGQKGTDWKGFVDYLEMAPGDMGESMINELALNPRASLVFNDLVQASDTIQSLEDEYFEVEQVSHLDSFSDSLDNVSGLEEAFALFRNSASNFRGRKGKEEAFNLIESDPSLNPEGIDLGEAFDAFMTGNKEEEIKTSEITALSTGNPLDKFENGPELFAHLDSSWNLLNDEQKNIIFKKYGSGNMMGEKLFVDPQQMALFPFHRGGFDLEWDEVTQDYAGLNFPSRPNWSPATAYSSTNFGFGFADNAYYDSFYTSLESDWDAAIEQDNPFGPDFLYKSGMVPEAHMVSVLQERYGESAPQMVQQILSKAHMAGVTQQEAKLTTLLTDSKYIGDTGNYTQEYASMGRLIADMDSMVAMNESEAPNTSSEVINNAPPNLPSETSAWTEELLQEAYSIHQAGVAADPTLNPISYDDFVTMATAYDSPNTYGLGTGGTDAGGFADDEWTDDTLSEAYEFAKNTLGDIDRNDFMVAVKSLGIGSGFFFNSFDLIADYLLQSLGKR